MSKKIALSMVIVMFCFSLASAQGGLRAKGPCLTRGHGLSDSESGALDARFAQRRQEAAAQEKASYEDIVRRAVKDENKASLHFERLSKGLSMAPMYGGGAGGVGCGMSYTLDSYTVPGWRYAENNTYYVVLLKSDYEKAENNISTPVVIRAWGVAGPQKTAVHATTYNAADNYTKSAFSSWQKANQPGVFIEHKRKLPHKEVTVNGKKYVVIEK